MEPVINFLVPSKRNTFQSVIVSDTNYTFVVFNYEKIQWYSPPNLGGNPETGTGGKAARVILTYTKVAT